MIQSLKFVGTDSEPHWPKSFIRLTGNSEPQTTNPFVSSTLPSWCLCVPAAYIKPCSRNDPNINACGKEHAIYAIPHFINGKYVLHQAHFLRSPNKGKAEVVPTCHADEWWSEGTAPRIPKICTKWRWAVIFTRWPVGPDEHCRYALGRKMRWPLSPSWRNEQNISCLWQVSSPESSVTQ